MERRKVLISPDFAPCDHLLIQRLVCVSKELEFGYFYLSWDKAEILKSLGGNLFSISSMSEWYSHYSIMNQFDQIQLLQDTVFFDDDEHLPFI